MPPKVLVTGGSGFLGSRVAKSYADSGARVTVLCRRRPGPEVASSGKGSIEFVALDLLALNPDTSVVFAKQDLVIHAAAHIRVRNLDDRVQQRKVNVDGTRKVVDACIRHGVRRLVHVSTCAAIGIPETAGQPADERFEFNLEHLDQGYNLTKLAAERLVLAANGDTLETVVVNPGFIFGWEGSHFRGREVLDRVLKRPFVFCTDGGLSIVHVDDVVAGIRQAAARGRPGERYILSGENVTFRQIADVVCKVSGRRRWVVSVPPPLTRFAASVLKRVPVGPAITIGAHLAGLERYSHQHYSSAKAMSELAYEPRPFSEIAKDGLSNAR